MSSTNPFTVKDQTELIELNKRQTEIKALISKTQTEIIDRELAIKPLRVKIKRLRAEFKINDFKRFKIDGSEVKLITPKVLRKKSERPKSKMELIKIGKDILKSAPADIQAEMLKILRGE